MPKPFDSYIRACSRCDGYFKSETKSRKICNNCQIVPGNRKTPKTLNNTGNIK
jgi:hypothetical protein